MVPKVKYCNHRSHAYTLLNTIFVEWRYISVVVAVLSQFLLHLFSHAAGHSLHEVMLPILGFLSLQRPDY